jgi:hypothetical protein
VPISAERAMQRIGGRRMTTPDLELKGYRSELESPEGPLLVRFWQRKRNRAKLVAIVRSQPLVSFALSRE